MIMSSSKLNIYLTKIIAKMLYYISLIINYGSFINFDDVFLKIRRSNFYNHKL